MKLKLLGYALLIVVGFLLRFVLEGGPKVVVERDVVVHAAAIEDDEPPASPGPRAKIIYKYVGADQVVRAPGAAADEVVKFCKPVTLATVDTVEVERQVVLRSGVTRDGWWLQRGRVDLTGFTNDGDLVRSSFSTRPNFDFRTSGDSILVRYPRWSLFRQGLEVAVPFVLGLVAGGGF